MLPIDRPKGLLLRRVARRLLRLVRLVVGEGLLGALAPAHIEQLGTRLGARRRRLLQQRDALVDAHLHTPLRVELAGIIVVTLLGI